jgi:two-component system catabolic regulation response regulator CreB
LNQDILIVEDEKEIADTLVYALSSDRFSVDWAADCTSANQCLASKIYSIAVFDVGLPDGDGFELLKALRQSNHANRDIPVIFLTARNEEIDRIVGLEIGADDYVCKPFSPRELATRVKVVLKRGSNRAYNTTVNSADRSAEESDIAGNSEKQVAPKVKPSDQFNHNQNKRIVSLNQTPLDLTRAEYLLLTCMLDHSGQVFSRRQLIDYVWSANHPSDDRAIDTHIKTLRAKLRSHNPHTDFIVTHRGFGYSLDV